MADTVKPGSGPTGTKPVVDGVKIVTGSTKVPIDGEDLTVIGVVWPCMGQPAGALCTLEDGEDHELDPSRLKFEASTTGTKP